MSKKSANLFLSCTELCEMKTATKTGLPIEILMWPVKRYYNILGNVASFEMTNDDEKMDYINLYKIIELNGHLCN